MEPQRAFSGGYAPDVPKNTVGDDDMKASVLIEIGLAIVRAGARIARRQSAKAKRRYRRVRAYNDVVMGLAKMDDARVLTGMERLRRAAEEVVK